MNQQTLIVIKPDGLKKSLTGNILTRLSETKLEIVASKIVRVNKALAIEHYKEMQDEPFFNDLIKYIQGELHNRKKVMAMVYWGKDAINKVRALAGTTNPEEAESTTIRGSFGRITTKGIYENVLHASSNAEEAEREIKLWFEPEDVIVDMYPTKTVTIDKQRRKVWA
ncbi:MAG: nucleoside-diphosphate kinase [Candidatus Omnitrophota bacterium]|jgi:nucleoside-diphosphate kinase|nr:nucleoside-diphosphate kinase [Candidatus Omnitrophota bacterium]|tara:strand:+ start:139 stop:642 length:504 start_codon:yes stop_codon:yes gene_type:complete